MTKLTPGMWKVALKLDMAGWGWCLFEWLSRCGLSVARSGPVSTSDVFSICTALASDKLQCKVGIKRTGVGVKQILTQDPDVSFHS